MEKTDNLTANLSQLRVTPEMKTKLRMIAQRRGIRRVADLQRYVLTLFIQREEAENGELVSDGANW